MPVRENSKGFDAEKSLNAFSTSPLEQNFLSEKVSKYLKKKKW